MATKISCGAPRLPRRLVLVSLLASAGGVVLPSCGGGGGAGGALAGVDSGGTGSFSTGRISGFGSVIVNGVRYEDNAARIVDEDDESKVLAPQDLRLGMVVRVEGGSISAGTATTLPVAVAAVITLESEVKGPVQSKTGADTLVVLGQTVKVNAATVYEGTSFLAITLGTVVEVSGFVAAGGEVIATRIAPEDGAGQYKVRGFVSNLDTAARTFRLGTATFNFAATPADRLPAAGLADGQFVRVRTATTPNAGGQWPVARIDARATIDDVGEAEVEGVLLQSGGVFTVNGLRIDTSRLPAGTTLPVGQRVEVEGAIVNGILVAREIALEDGDDEARVDVRGTVTAVNTGARTFVVRGVTFRHSGITQVEDGSIATNLVVGAEVDVRGQLGSDGIVEASRIDFRS